MTGGYGRTPESLDEVAQLGSWPQSGKLEQVAGDDAGAVVPVDQFGRDLLGLLQVVDGLLLLRRPRRRVSSLNCGRPRAMARHSTQRLDCPLP